MAIPRKGSRKIIVGDLEYRWTIRSKPTYSQAALGASVTVGIELFDDPRSLLSVQIPWVRCDNWIGKPKIPVTPVHISQSINQALKVGWDPLERGTFNIIHTVE